MEPLEFMERLAAVVPRPRLHRSGFTGVLAAKTKLRSQIVPALAERAPETSSEDAHAQGAPVRMSWARLLKAVRFALRTGNPSNAIYSHVALDDRTVVSILVSQAHCWTAGREYSLRCWRLLDPADTLRRGRHPVRWL